MDLATFRDRFPEYDAASDELVQLCLDEAEAVTPSDPWDDLQDVGIQWEAAYLLSIDPRSRDLARKPPGKDQENVYRAQRLRYTRIVAGGPYVP